MLEQLSHELHDAVHGANIRCCRCRKCGFCRRTRASLLREIACRHRRPQSVGAHARDSARLRPAHGTADRCVTGISSHLGLRARLHGVCRHRDHALHVHDGLPADVCRVLHHALPQSSAHVSGFSFYIQVVGWLPPCDRLPCGISAGLGRRNCEKAEMHRRVGYARAELTLLTVLSSTKSTACTVALVAD